MEKIPQDFRFLCISTLKYKPKFENILTKFVTVDEAKDTPWPSSIDGNKKAALIKSLAIQIRYLAIKV